MLLEPACGSLGTRVHGSNPISCSGDHSETRRGIETDLGIEGHKIDIFYDRLSDQNPVERIFMDRRQCGSLCNVVWPQRERSASQLFHCILPPATGVSDP